MAKNKFKNDIFIFCTDSKREFLSKEFKDYLNFHDIAHQRSCSHTTQQNGLAERNKHLNKNQISKEFWAEAALTATYLINRMTSSSLKNITLIKKLVKLSPDYSKLRVFGCKCFVFTNKNDTFSSRAIPCAFLSYTDNKKNYRCYDFKIEKLYISRNVSFLEKGSFLF